MSFIDPHGHGWVGLVERDRKTDSVAIYSWLTIHPLRRELPQNVSTTTQHVTTYEHKCWVVSDMFGWGVTIPVVVDRNLYVRWESLH